MAIEWGSVALIWLSGFVFALSHSLLASKTCKQYCYAYGLQEPRYRLLYSCVAIVATAIWVFYVHQLPDSALYQSDGLLWWLLIAIQGFGLIVALAAFYPIDGLVFLGLRKAQEGREPLLSHLKRQTALSGIYRFGLGRFE